MAKLLSPSIFSKKIFILNKGSSRIDNSKEWHNLGILSEVKPEESFGITSYFIDLLPCPPQLNPLMFDIVWRRLTFYSIVFCVFHINFVLRKERFNKNYWILNSVVFGFQKIYFSFNILVLEGYWDVLLCWKPELGKWRYHNNYS